MNRRLLTLLLIAALAATAAWVWPTLYRYEKITVQQDTYLVRIHRLSGRADILVPEEGWVPADQPWGGEPDVPPTDGPT